MKLVAADFGKRGGDCRADEQDHPAQIDPDEEQRQCRQGAVHDLIRRHPCDVEREAHFRALERDRREHPGDQRRAPGNTTRRHEQVEECQHQRADAQSQQVRQERQRVVGNRHCCGGSLERPLGRNDRSPDQCRDRDKAKRVDDDPPHEGARSQYAPHGIDLAFDLRHQHDRGEHHERNAHALDLGGARSEFGEVSPHRAAAAGEQKFEQRRFQRVEPGVEQRQAGHVRECHREQRHQAEQGGESKVAGDAIDVDVAHSPIHAHDKIDEHPHADQHRGAAGSTGKRCVSVGASRARNEPPIPRRPLKISGIATISPAWRRRRGLCGGA